MIQILESILPYIKGLYTLPWILVGFIITFILSRFFGDERVNKLMRKIGLFLLFVFVPLLLFKILLNVNFKHDELVFTIVCLITLVLMYIFAYFFARYRLKKLKFTGRNKTDYIKTVITNQGRSSAFVGGAMLAINEWRVYATLYMIIGAIFLFAIIPYILSYLHNKEIIKAEKTIKIQTLPCYLKIFPWYLLLFAFTAIIIHAMTGVTHRDFGDSGIIFDFITALTIPAALYYVGAGVHFKDIKDMIKKFYKKETTIDRNQNWIWTKDIFLLTIILTSFLTIFILSLLLISQIVSKEWFAVIAINSILPITSTNMFLVPYGINKKVTALSVTLTTIVSVPIVVALIFVFNILFV